MYKECSECHERLEEKELKKEAHVFGEGVLKDGIACSENATLVYTCAGCGETKEETVTSHAYEKTDEKAATCDTAGYTHYECSVCGEAKTEYNDPIGHSIKNPSIITEVTCLENGYEEGICENCGEVVGKTVLATGHTPSEFSLTDEYCGEHRIGDIVCSECKEILASFGHSYTSTVTDLGCEVGIKTTYTCSLCNDTYEETTAPIGHIAGEWYEADAPTCKESGKAMRKCLVCGEVCEEESIAVIDHVYKSSVFGNVITYTCSCGDSYTVTAERTVTVTFYSNGGTRIDALTVKQGDSAELPSPTREGYNFAGWYLDEQLTNLCTDDGFYADTALYAAWTLAEVSGETNTNNIITGAPLDFGFEIESDNALTDEQLLSLISIENTQGAKPTLKIVSRNGNKYTISSDEFAGGENYSVLLHDGIRFTETDGNVLWFITADKNKTTIEYADGVVFIAESDIYGAIEEDGVVFLLFRNDLLDPDDTVVVYGEDIYDVLLIINVDAEGTIEGLYAYAVSAADEAEVFNEYDIYYSGALEDYELEFSSDYAEELINETRNSVAYKQFEYAAKQYAANSGEKYTLKEIVIAPKFGKVGNGVTVTVKVSAIFENKGNSTDKTLEITLEFNTTLTFNLTADVKSTSNFTFVLDTNASTRVDIYAMFTVAGETKRGTYDTMEYFSKLLEEAKEKGKFGGIDKDSAGNKKDTTLGVLTLRFGGLSIEFEVANVIAFEVSGEVGVSINVNLTTSFGVKNSSSGFSLIKSTKATSTISFYAMGKAELSALMKVKAEISLLGLVSARVEFAAGPYLLFGGMFTASAATNGSFDADLNGYLELGVKIEATAGVSAQISFKILWKKFTIVLYNKTWELYSSKLVILSVGTSKVPLYFTDEFEEHSYDIECNGEINISTDVDRNVLFFDIIEGGTAAEKAVCKFFLTGGALDGFTLTEDGILKFDGTSEFESFSLHIKVVYGDIYKIIAVTVHTSHTPITVEGKDASCEEDGYSEHVACSACGKTITDASTIPSHGHSYEKPTPSTEGKHVQVCLWCGDTVESECNLSFVYQHEANCMMGGHTEWYCYDCGNVVYKDKTEPTDHNYEVEIIPPTNCTDPEVTRYKCYACGHEYTVTGEPIGHNYVPTNFAGDCQNPGYTLYECGACGDSYMDNFTGTTEHSFESIVYPPTCSSEGYTYYYCELCGYGYEDNRTGTTEHNWETTVNPPSCMMGGFTLYYCLTCGHMEDRDYVAPTEHDWQVRYTEKSTCTVLGFTEYECPNCYGTKTEYSSEFGKHNIEFSENYFGGCNDMSYDIYRCTFCGYEEHRNETAAMGHDHQLQTMTPPTCTDAGEEYYECIRCGDGYIVPLPTIDHSYELYSFSDVTCTKPGYMIEFCTSCGTTREQTFGEPTGHSYSDGYCMSCGEPYYSEGLEFVDCYSYAALSGLGSFSGGELIIPSSYNGLPVTVIYAGIFDYNTTITSISLPGTIEVLESNLFRNCTALESITLGDGMREIESYAFTGCTALKSVIIPSSVTKIGGGVFFECASLETVLLPEGLQYVGANAFFNCTSLTEITLPYSLTYLGPAAFLGCEKLVRVYNYSAVREILSDTFYGCSALEEFSFEYVAFIGDYAFSGCSSLKTVNAFAIESIGVEAFYECTTLMNLYLGETLVFMDKGAFAYCASLTVVNIPGNLTDIPEEAFIGCKSLSYVSLGSVMTIGSSAFSGCTSLSDMLMSLNVTSIGGSAFKNCSSLTSIMLPEGISAISANTFDGCKALKSVYIPISVKSIARYAFNNCTTLEAVYYGGTAEDFANVSVSFKDYNSPLATATRYFYAEEKPSERGYFWHFAGFLTIEVWEYDGYSTDNNNYPENASDGLVYELSSNGNYYILTGIGSFTGAELIIPTHYNGLPVLEIATHAFHRNSNLTSIRIPDAVIIREEAFLNMQKLETIIIGNCATIEQYAFANCYTLKTAVIGEGATVGDAIFSECKALTDASFGYGAKFGAYVFYNCKALTEFVIPDGTVSIGKQFFDGCPALVSVTIPESLQFIGSLAFDDCTSLTVNYKSSEACFAIIYTQSTSTMWNGVTVNYNFGADNNGEKA